MGTYNQNEGEWKGEASLGGKDKEDKVKMTTKRNEEQNYWGKYSEQRNNMEKEKEFLTE